MADEQSSSSIERAVSVLIACSQDDRGLSVRELADLTGLSKSAVHRILGAFERSGMLVLDETLHRYVNGPRLIELAARIYKPVSAFQLVARPILLELRRDVDETVSLHTLVGDKRMILLQLESSQALRYAGRPDQLYPLDRGAASRALLASVGRGSESAPDGATGSCFVTRGERVDGVVGIAAPIAAPDGSAMSIGLSVPAARADKDAIAAMVERLERARLEVDAAFAELADSPTG